MSRMVIQNEVEKPVVVFENSYLVLSKSAADSLLILRWKRQINFEERVEGFMEAYSYSRQHQIRNWLINDEEIFLITPQEKQWVAGTWAELVAQTNISKIAVFTSASYTVLIAHTEFTLQAQENYKRYGKTRYEVFADLTTAISWIQE
jgi:hypothetical protein